MSRDNRKGQSINLVANQVSCQTDFSLTHKPKGVESADIFANRRIKKRGVATTVKNVDERHAWRITSSSRLSIINSLPP